MIFFFFFLKEKKISISAQFILTLKGHNSKSTQATIILLYALKPYGPYNSFLFYELCSQTRCKKHRRCFLKVYFFRF